MAITRADFPLPDVDDPLTAGFFAGAARDELVIPRCGGCGRYQWYPKDTCAACGDETFAWTPVSGRATLFTWAIVRRAFLPAFAEQVPFVTALVALDEDPRVRLCTYLVDVDPDAMLAPDSPVVVTFRDLTFPTVADRSVRVPMFTVVPQKEPFRAV